MAHPDESMPNEGKPNEDKPDGKIDPATVAALYVEHAVELRSFLIGVLRDYDLAGDVLQAAFVKCVEAGHTAQQESLKGWLFRVALNEALALRRRQAIHGKVVARLAWVRPEGGPAPDERLVRWESTEAVREALGQLPPEQRQVVRLRIYEEKTFAVIAKELKLPLGTVLTRMRLAMEKLRRKLDSKQE